MPILGSPHSHPFPQVQTAKPWFMLITGNLHHIINTCHCTYHWQLCFSLTPGVSVLDATHNALSSAPHAPFCPLRATLGPCSVAISTLLYYHWQLPLSHQCLGIFHLFINTQQCHACCFTHGTFWPLELHQDSLCFWMASIDSKDSSSSYCQAQSNCHTTSQGKAEQIQSASW